MNRLTFEEWCRNNGGNIKRDHQDHVGNISECGFSHEDSISWTEDKGLDIITESKQVISEGSRLPGGTNGKEIIAVDGRDGPDSRPRDHTIEVRGSYPNGRVIIR